MTKMFILIGQLRRDVMVLGKSEDPTELADAALVAVKEGRAQEAFVIEALAYETASQRNWAGIDDGVVHKPASIPPMNPGAGDQETIDTSQAVPAETIKGNIQAHSDEQVASGDLVDTGEADRRKEAASGAGLADNSQVLAKPAKGVKV